ncbi:MAG: hypothetical protein A4E49_02740 [Methanosaeta sp. PtaU1.Bin112]|nr:MAG: hypothetical protein A4E49_02740 [Methanosaeta sp. PtaU1.Bin112]
MIRAIGLLGFTGCIILFALIGPAFSQEIVLSTHENYTLESCILQVEDIDSLAEEVWISIPAAPGQSSSMVLGMNETITCGNETATVKKFYSGDSYDIVCLKLLNSSISG